MRTLAIALVLASTSAFACPDLTGKYAACVSNTGNSSGSTDVEVTQSIQNKVTVYSITQTSNETHERENELVRADGKTVSTSQTEDGTTFKIDQTASCNGTKSLNMKSVVTMNGKPFSNVNVVVSKSANRMTYVASGTMMGQQINETITCE